MTKVKLKDAIKDLTTDAAKVRDDAFFLFFPSESYSYSP